jgi:uncharacterized protein (TIGR02246 family)
VVEPTQAIRELFRAIDAKDATAIAALLTRDASMVDEVTRGWMTGAETLRLHLESTLASIETMNSEVRDLRVREVGNFATATCTLVQTYRFDGESVAITAPTSFSLERQGGSWLIVQMHSVPLADN